MTAHKHDNMLSYGIAIYQPDDLLERVEVETIARKITHPKPEFADRIARLRQIRLIDEKQYARLKRELPYFCGGLFSPRYRRRENFAAIQYFTLDFDHFSQAGISKEETAEKLQYDPHIRLLFTTPGGDGLKAVFILNDPCTDAGRYTHFYKAFARVFATKYQLEKVTDWVTHDVTRATFFSADPKAWDNPTATPVKMEDYIPDTISPLYSDVEKQFQALAKENPPAQTAQPAHGPDEVTFVFIRSRLNPGYRPKREKNIFVPEQLTEAVPMIREALGKEQITLTDVKSIHFGKQLKVQMKEYWAEINIYYGKKGFTIVRTTKTGGNRELADLAYQIIDLALN